MLVSPLKKLSRHLNFNFMLMMVVVFGASLLLASTISGQTITGAISGTVVDPNGANVPGATITLTNDQNNDKREQPTNEAGLFRFPSVQPGVYTLKIEHAGFETLQRTKVVSAPTRILRSAI